MFRQSIPVLHVTSSSAAEDFYCNRLGFQKRFAYRVDDTSSDPCDMGLVRDDAWLHLSSFSGDGGSGGCVYLLVDDVDGLHAELLQRRVRIDLEPTDQTWATATCTCETRTATAFRFTRPLDR